MEKDKAGEIISIESIRKAILNEAEENQEIEDAVMRVARKNGLSITSAMSVQRLLQQDEELVIEQDTGRVLKVIKPVEKEEHQTSPE